MSKKRILSIAPGREELWDMAEKQGYVWIKTENGFVTTDELDNYARIKTGIYGVWLSQKDYGKTWALTENELKHKEDQKRKPELMKRK